jgi:hypothetical protein
MITIIAIQILNPNLNPNPIPTLIPTLLKIVVQG